MSDEETNEILPRISIVIPMHNEAETVDILFSTLTPVLRSISRSFEVIAINDGSNDDTLDRLLFIQSRSPELRVVDLSRNFGKEAALTAGLRFCSGACAIILDADLQDPPELLPAMLDKWAEGYEMVIAVHRNRQSDSIWRRVAAHWFYRLLNSVSNTSLIPHAGDFRLLDRVVIDAFLSLPERTRFNKGLFAWIGFRQHLIEHTRPLRSSGSSKFTARKLLRLALDGITSFSSFPLRLWAYVGCLIAILALFYGLLIVARTLLLGIDVPGYASIIVAVMFLGGINLFSIGVLGEYIGRVFLEAKQRPIFIVRKVHEPHVLAD